MGTSMQRISLDERLAVDYRWNKDKASRLGDELNLMMNLE